MSLEKTAPDVLQYMLTFLDHGELHRIRLVGKEWNNLCDLSQSTLQLSTTTPAELIKYWMLKLSNIRRIHLSHNIHIDDQLAEAMLVWDAKQEAARRQETLDALGNTTGAAGQGELKPSALIETSVEGNESIDEEGDVLALGETKGLRAREEKERSLDSHGLPLCLVEANPLLDTPSEDRVEAA